MGKLLQVNTGYQAVLLPSTAGLRNFNPGDQVVVSDAEYAGLTGGTINATTILQSGVPDPARRTSDTFAEPSAYGAFTTANGGVVSTGISVVTGPAAGVTYLPGFLQVAPSSPGSVPPVAGPVVGAGTDIEVFHVQGAVVSVAPVSKNWFGARFDAAAVTTNASPLVLDPAILLSDTGRPVTGTGIPANSFIQGVVPGVSFNISSTQATYTAANATASGTITASILSTTKWAGGTVPTFTATAGAIDYFLFVTYDGGLTYLNTITTKNIN